MLKLQFAEAGYIKGKTFVPERSHVILCAAVSLMISFIILTGCATVPLPKQADTQESLKATASLYWKFRMEDNYKDTFAMEDKETLQQKLSRSKKPLYQAYEDRARAIKNTEIKSCSVKDATVEDGKGRVDVEFTFILPEIPRPVHQIVSDEWVFKDGKWLHILP